MGKYHREVDQCLKQAARNVPSENVKIIKNYMKSELDFYGLKVPVQRKISKNGYSFYELSPAKIDNIWREIWSQSSNFEVMAQALYYYDHQSTKPGFEKYWKVLKSFVDRIENWAHSDTLSSMLAKQLELQPEVVFPVFKKWNSSKKPWRRRQSIVSLLYYASGRKKVLPFKDMLPLVENLIEDEHFYVQRGVGWTLRELYTVYPEQTLPVIEKHLDKLTSIAFTTSVERVPLAVKERLKKKRKTLRKKS